MGMRGQAGHVSRHGAKEASRELGTIQLCEVLGTLPHIKHTRVYGRGVHAHVTHGVAIVGPLKVRPFLRELWQPVLLCQTQLVIE